MADPGLGFEGGFFSYGEETIWGTAVTRTLTHKLRSGGDGVEDTIDEITAEEINSINLDEDDSIGGNKSVSGPLVITARYEGHEVLLKHALGWVVTSQPDVTTAPTVFQHVFTITNDLPHGNAEGLTIEIDRDLSEMLCEGCKIASVEWAMDVGGFMIITFNIVAEDSDLVANPTGGLTFPSAPFVKSVDKPGSGYVLTYNSNELLAQNIRVTLNNNLDVDRRFLGVKNTNNLGIISEPMRSAKILVEVSFTIEFNNENQYNDFQAHTQRVAKIWFEGTTIEAPYSYTYQFDFPAFRIRGGTPRPDSEGRITVDYTGRAYWTSSSAKEFKVTLINTTINCGI